MKTLKTLFLFLALVCAGNSFGQTKEETIEWLETNGKEFIEPRYIEKYSDGQYNYIIIKIQVKKDALIIKQEIMHQGSSDNIKIIENIYYWNQLLYEDIKSVIIGHYTESVNHVKFFKLKYQNDKNEIEILELFFLKDNEENAKRVIKAIMHLAKLSGAKENKQTF